MKLRKILVLASLLIVYLAVSPKRAWAGRMDCSISGATCGFGGLLTSSPAAAISGTGWVANVSTAVYQNGSTFTYAYTFVLNPNAVMGGSMIVMTSLTTATTLAQDNFLQSLMYGAVTDQTSAGLTLGAIAFDFNPSSLAVSLKGSGLAYTPGATKTLTIYAQSNEGPGAGNFSATDGGSGTTASVLDPVPEPASMLLLCSGAGLLGIGEFLKRRLIKSARQARVEI